jgi:AcrR family transcriptional regulator
MFMGFKKLENIDEAIIDAAIEVGAANATNRFSTKTLARKCGISEFVIYDHFKTKDNLLDVADHKIGDDFSEYLISKTKTCASNYALWNACFDFFLARPSYSLFAVHYGMVYPWSLAKSRDKEAAQNYIAAVAMEVLSGRPSLGTKHIYYLVGAAFVGQILGYATMVIQGQVMDTPEFRQIVSGISINGLKGIKAVPLSEKK